MFAEFFSSSSSPSSSLSATTTSRGCPSASYLTHPLGVLCAHSQAFITGAARSYAWGGANKRLAAIAVPKATAVVMEQAVSAASALLALEVDAGCAVRALLAISI